MSKIGKNGGWLKFWMQRFGRGDLGEALHLWSGGTSDGCFRGVLTGRIELV